MALVLYKPAFWFALIAQAILLIWFARRLNLRWRSAWFLRVALIALVLYGVFSPKGELLRRPVVDNQVLIIDQSDSVSAEDQTHVQEISQQWMAGGQGRLTIVYGASAEPVISGQDNWPNVDSRGSDVLAALEMADEMLGIRSGNVYLASDGAIGSQAAIDSAIDTLYADGHTLSLIALATRESGRDIYVGPLWVPTGLWENTQFVAVLPIYLPEESEVRFRLEIDDVVWSEHSDFLPAGEHILSFPAQARTEGILILSASVSVDGDQNPENNQAYATIPVFAAPDALFVTSDEFAASGFSQALRQTGMRLIVTSPSSFPTELKNLETYKVIFLHNLLVSELTDEQLIAIKLFVSQFGRGLVIIGGKSSYTLGGYKNSLLEPLLPISLVPPERKERVPETLVLVLDVSSSMRLRSESNVRRINLAKEAALRAIEILQSDDYLGVMTFSGESFWDVPIHQVGEGISLRQSQDAVSGIVIGSVTYMYKAMQAAIDEIQANLTTDTPHLLLLSDGESFDGSPEEFVALAAAAQEQGIVISTIALGDESDAELMGLIAQAGNGRLYYVQDPDQLPSIMISESRAARSENIQEGLTSLVEGEKGHPLLSGLSVSDMPNLSGYNAVSSRAEEGAEDVLLSASFEDPLLSVWQYGLGRVAAWLGDAGEKWATEWLDWQNLGNFWAQVVRYTLPDPSLQPTQVQVNVHDDEVTVTTYIRTPEMAPVNLAGVKFSYAESDGDVFAGNIPQAAPGKYERIFHIAEEGAYRGVVTVIVDENEQVVLAPFAINYPEEWKPVSLNDAQQVIQNWVDRSNGLDIVIEDLLEGDEEQREQSALSIASDWLLIALVFLWPIEVAIRRRWLPWQ